MRIGIHNAKESYSDKWIYYCQKNNIDYKIVNCYQTDIINQLSDCDVLMWHYHHTGSKDTLIATQLLHAVEAAGKFVYPDYKTRWFFDDKIGQKYLLEAIDAPLIPTYVFFSKKEALDWLNTAQFPKVFKLRRGSGSKNVKLLKSRMKAMVAIHKAFGYGFRQYDPWGGLKERWRLFRLGQTNFRDLVEGVGRFFIKTRFEKIIGRERGYVYFQDFIEGCTYDIRTTVIGNKCYALKRQVRENDFRASGSHIESHDPDDIPLEVVDISFQVSHKLQLQSVAFDFLITQDNKPVITELSYAFGWDEGDNDFYWDAQLNLHRTPFDPFGEMINNIIGDKSRIVVKHKI